MTTMRTKKIKHTFWAELRKNKLLFLMIAPAVLWFFVFSYLPMSGVYLAFTKFNFIDGLFHSPFVGFRNFEFLFFSGTIGRLIANTVAYNLAFILVGNLFQITCAIILSEIPGRVFRKTSQSLMFLPYFISYVMVGVFAYNLLNYSGVVNTWITALGGRKISFYTTSGIWKYIIVAFNTWKGLGYGTIVYLAAITSIDPEYYEVAKISGASILQQIRYITLPLLRPMFVFLLLFSLGGIMKGQFDLFYNLIGSNGLLYSATDVIDTYVYRALTVNFDMGMGSAAGLFQSSFGLLMVLGVNFIVRKIQPDYALF
ncbi:MAG: ABC transporter permease subunit [Clostridia bacterium]|nr:ABC transporter permease subunit [Clostridia bacterium]